MKLIYFLFFLSFSALSSDRAFIIVDSTPDNYIVAEDVHVFESQGINSRYLEKHFNMKGNQTASIVSWLKKNHFVFLGGKFSYSFCMNKKIKGKDIPTCNDDYNPKGMFTKKTIKSFMLDKNFSLFFPKLSLDKLNIDGHFILSNGKPIKLKRNSPVIKIENEMIRSYKNLDKDSTSLYRFAHYMGLMKIKESFKKGKTDYSYCGKIFNRDIECNKNLLGSYSLTGIMLYEFSKSCYSCSNESKLRLKYYAANYLLRVPGRNDFQFLGRKIFNNKKEEFKSFIPKEYVFLDELYKWALKSNFSAR